MSHIGEGAFGVVKKIK